MQFSRYVLVACAVALSGCRSVYFHSQTTIFPDGSVKRAILQPEYETPDEIKDPAVWDQITWSTEKPIDAFFGDIHELPIVDADDESSYFAAWKTVGPGEELPNHYLKTGQDETSESTLERSFERRDLGLAVEFIWEETLTEVVTLAEMRAARREAITLFLSLVEPTLQRSLGEEYDISELMAWFRKEGTAILADLTDETYDFVRSVPRSMSGDKYEVLLKRRIASVCDAHGLPGIFDDGGTLQEKMLLQFATNLIRKTVKRRGGLAISPEIVDGLLGAIGMTDSEKKPALTQRIRKEWKHVINSRPGGKDAVDKQEKKLMTQILGVHSGIDPSPFQHFQFTMNMPGTLVETNGRILGNNRVRWTFHESKAWPSGFTMRARSLLDQTENIPEMQTWRKIHGQELLPRVAELVSEHPELIDTLKKCRAAGTLSPLKQLFNTTADNDVAKLAGTVLRLLTVVNGKR